MKPCPRCNGTAFTHIPDSLAHACKTCGFVWVGFDDDDMRPGATVAQWLEDAYGVPNTTDDKWNARETA